MFNINKLIKNSTKNTFDKSFFNKKNKVLNKLMGDKDRDGVNNFMDCKVNNPKFHGGEAMWGKLKEKNINIITTPKKRKLIRKRFEQNPELLSLAANSNIYGQTRKQGNVRPIANYNQDMKEIYLRDDLFKKRVTNTRGKNLNKATLPHEAQHHWDYQNLPISELNKDLEERKKLSMKYSPSKRQADDKEYENFREEYYNLPLESRAQAREQTGFKQYYKVPQKEVDGASVAIQNHWKKMDEKQRNKERQLKPDTDGDRVPDEYDCSPNNVMRQDWDYDSAKKEGKYIKYMTPQEYLKKTEGGMESGESQRDWLNRGYYDMETEKTEPIEKLGGYIKNPNIKVRIPFVGNKERFGMADHEGRHRAYAAELVGEEKIPVAVPSPQEWRSDEVVNEFIDKRFSDAGEGYKNQWKDRFKEDFPEEIMDKTSIQTYKEILKNKNLLNDQTYNS